MTTDDTSAMFDALNFGSGPPAEDPIPRDGYGRPLIVDPETGEATPYTRASTMADLIDNKYGLHQWQMGLAVQGVGHRGDLAAIAASLPPYDLMNKAQKQELREVVEASLEVSKAYAKANHGTAVHGFTDPFRISGPVPDELKADVDSYERVMADTGIVRLCSEVFVVNDRLKIAGTLDHVSAVPALNQSLVGDTKTGKADMRKTTIQVATYAESQVYDPETGKRTPLREHLEELTGKPIPPINPDAGLYIHVPRGEGRTTLHPLNLKDGRRMLEICAQVRDWHRDKSMVRDDATEMLSNTRNIPAMKAIDAAADLPTLKAVVKAFGWCWNDRLNKYAETRWAEFGRPTS